MHLLGERPRRSASTSAEILTVAIGLSGISLFLAVHPWAKTIASGDFGNRHRNKPCICTINAKNQRLSRHANPVRRAILIAPEMARPDLLRRRESVRKGKHTKRTEPALNAATQHQPSPSPPSSSARPRNLGEFNALLIAAGVNRISAEELGALRERRNPDDLARAAMQAHANPNARAYLDKAIAEVRGATHTAQTQAPPEPEPMPPAPPPEQPPEGWAQQSDGYDRDPRDWNHGSTRTENAGHERNEKGDRLSVHVYGSGAALCFEPDQTRRGDHTIALDAARSTGPRAYDWGGKIRLQMTQAELPVVAGVLLGRIAKCEYGNHGPENDKGFSLENQDGKIFARVFAKGKSPCAVPIGPEDAYRVTALVVRQLRENTPWLEAGDVIRLVAEVVARLKN